MFFVVVFLWITTKVGLTSNQLHTYTFESQPESVEIEIEIEYKIKVIGNDIIFIITFHRFINIFFHFVSINLFNTYI